MAGGTGFSEFKLGFWVALGVFVAMMAANLVTSLPHKLGKGAA